MLFPAAWSAQQRAADLAQHVEETVTGVRVVKGFGQEVREIASLASAARTAVRRADAHRAADGPARGHARRDARRGQVAVLALGG